MSSACEGDAPRDQMALSTFSPRSLKSKVASEAPAPLEGGGLAPKPERVTACLATRLHNFPDQESFLPGRPFFMFAETSHLLIGAVCDYAPAVLVAPVRHERTQAGRAQSLKDMKRIVTDDAMGAARRVGRFVAGRYSLSAQRRANKRRSNAAVRTLVGCHARPIRWLRAASGRIEWSWHPLFAPRRRTFFEPTRFWINH